MAIVNNSKLTTSKESLLKKGSQLCYDYQADPLPRFDIPDREDSL